MKAIYTTLLTLMLSPALTGCIFLIDTDNFHATDVVTTSASHVPGSAIDLESINGDLEVVADPSVSQAQITVDYTCVGETLEEAEDRVDHATLDVRRSSDAARTLVVRGECGWGRRNNDAISIRVRLPDADGVTMDTTNGGITVRGTDGVLIARTSNGSIDVRDHYGSIDVESSNGYIDLDGVAGPVFGVTSNGTIDATLYDDEPGPVELVSSNGSVTLRVGAAFTGRVDLSTTNGRATVSDPYHRVTRRDLGSTSGYVEIEGSSPRSRLSTTNGDVRLEIDG